MEISANELQNLIIRRVQNYPQLEKLIADGAIAKKGAWYEILNGKGFEALIDYAAAVRVEGKKTLVKVRKPSKSLQKLAAKATAE